LRDSVDETGETPPRLKPLAKRIVYVVATANVAVAVVGLLAPGEFLLSSGTPVRYLFGEVHLEGMFTVMLAQIALYSATVHAARADRLGATTLCVCTPLLFPGFTPTILTIPLFNFRAITALPDALRLPHGGLLLFAAILWNFEALQDRDADDVRPSVVGGGVSSYLQRHRWRVVSRVAAYIFVSTESVRGTGGLAAGAWITGLASLQYDTALGGLAFPASTLLTVAVTALWFAERTEHDGTHTGAAVAEESEAVE